MLKRLGLLLLIGFFLSVAVRAFQRDTAQEDVEQSGLIAQLRRMFSGSEEEERDRNNVDDSGIDRDDTSFAPAGGATDPANADDSDNADESNTGRTGATDEDEQSPRQRSNRAENDDANLMW